MSPKGNGTVKIKVVIPIVVALVAALASYFGSMADTTAQIVGVQNIVDSLSLEQSTFKSEIKELKATVEKGDNRSEVADTSMIRQIGDLAHEMNIFKINMKNGFDKILEKLE